MTGEKQAQVTLPFLFDSKRLYATRTFQSTSEAAAKARRMGVRYYSRNTLEDGSTQVSIYLKNDLMIAAFFMKQSDVDDFIENALQEDKNDPASL